MTPPSCTRPLLPRKLELELELELSQRSRHNTPTRAAAASATPAAVQATGRPRAPPWTLATQPASGPAHCPMPAKAPATPGFPAGRHSLPIIPSPTSPTRPLATPQSDPAPATKNNTPDQASANQEGFASDDDYVGRSMRYVLRSSSLARTYSTRMTNRTPETQRCGFTRKLYCALVSRLYRDRCLMVMELPPPHSSARGRSHSPTHAPHLPHATPSGLPRHWRLRTPDTGLDRLHLAGCIAT